jgi:glycosyltransferase involved in cell wall biosynthesis
MHILMVAPQPFFRPRGTPFSVLHRIRALSRLGHTVELVTYPFGESPEIDGLTIHRAPRPPLVRDVGIGPSFAKILLDAPLFRLAERLAATGRFDLLHTHEEAGWIGQGGGGGGGVVRASCMPPQSSPPPRPPPPPPPPYGLPHLYDMHSSLPQQLANFGRFNLGPIVSVFRRLELRTLRSADAVIAICPELHDHVLETGYDGPLETIENTLDFDVPEPEPGETARLRSELDVGDAPAIVYTGTLEPYQGLDLLIAAAPAVRDAAPHARFILVGGAQPRIDELRTDARRHGVEDLFRFVPAVPPTHVFRYLRLADVLVTTRSRGTNTPLKIYQYLRAGRAIVATRIRSHTQVLDDASAELVQPDPASIAAGIVTVLDNPSRAAALAAGAARLAQERYGEEAYMRSLASLLERIPLRPAA